jgi:hypothetical protein
MLIYEDFLMMQRQSYVPKANWRVRLLDPDNDTRTFQQLEFVQLFGCLMMENEFEALEREISIAARKELVKKFYTKYLMHSCFLTNSEYFEQIQKQALQEIAGEAWGQVKPRRTEYRISLTELRESIKNFMRGDLKDQFGIATLDTIKTHIQKKKKYLFVYDQDDEQNVAFVWRRNGGPHICIFNRDTQFCEKIMGIFEADFSEAIKDKYIQQDRDETHHGVIPCEGEQAPIYVLIKRKLRQLLKRSHVFKPEVTDFLMVCVSYAYVDYARELFKRAWDRYEFNPYKGFYDFEVKQLCPDNMVKQLFDDCARSATRAGAKKKFLIPVFDTEAKREIGYLFVDFSLPLRKQVKFHYFSHIGPSGWKDRFGLEHMKLEPLDQEERPTSIGKKIKKIIEHGYGIKIVHMDTMARLIRQLLWKQGKILLSKKKPLYRNPPGLCRRADEVLIKMHANRKVLCQVLGRVVITQDLTDNELRALASVVLDKDELNKRKLYTMVASKMRGAGFDAEKLYRGAESVRSKKELWTRAKLALRNFIHNKLEIDNIVVMAVAFLKQEYISKYGNKLHSPIENLFELAGLKKPKEIPFIESFTTLAWQQKSRSRRVAWIDVPNVFQYLVALVMCYGDASIRSKVLRPLIAQKIIHQDEIRTLLSWDSRQMTQLDWAIYLARLLDIRIGIKRLELYKERLLNVTEKPDNFYLTKKKLAHINVLLDSCRQKELQDYMPALLIAMTELHKALSPRLDITIKNRYEYDTRGRKTPLADRVDLFFEALYAIKACHFKCQSIAPSLQKVKSALELHLKDNCKKLESILKFELEDMDGKIAFLQEARGFSFFSSIRFRRHSPYTAILDENTELKIPSAFLFSSH